MDKLYENIQVDINFFLLIKEIKSKKYNLHLLFVLKKANYNNFNINYVAFPNINEQIKITKILSQIDEKIEEYENKKKKLEELKKGLIQKLLTGSIRVF